MQDNGSQSRDIIPIRGRAAARLLNCLGIHTWFPDQALAEYDKTNHSVTVYGNVQTVIADITPLGYYRTRWFDHESSTVWSMIAAVPGQTVLTFEQDFVHDLRPVGRERHMGISKGTSEFHEVRDQVENSLSIAYYMAQNRKKFSLAPIG